MHRLNPISPIDPSFVHIAPSIHFRRANSMAADSDSESTMNLQDPDLILLFTWTGARPQEIAKYTSGYTKLFPSTPIMVITTCINALLYRSSVRKQRSLIPAILIILSSHLSSNFLVHCFSETGAHKCVQFAKAYLNSTGRSLPVSALYLDSARGTLHLSTTATATQAWRESTKGHHSALHLHVLTSLLAYTLAASSWTTYPVITDAISIGRFQPQLDLLHFDKSRRALNDASLWDVCGVPRCYLFATADKLTDPRSVLEHARDAEKLGAVVTLTQFENHASERCGGHVQAPSRSNAERYWATVQRTWGACASTDTSASTSTAPMKCGVDVEKAAAYIYVTDTSTKAKARPETEVDNIHVSIHELPSHSTLSPTCLSSPVDQLPQTPPTAPIPIPSTILSASSSIYSSSSSSSSEALTLPTAHTATSSPNQFPTTTSTPLPTSPSTPFPIPALGPPSTSTSTYTGPSKLCIKNPNRPRWYDCLRPVPGYAGWGGMGVDTKVYCYERLTRKQQKQTQTRTRRPEWERELELERDGEGEGEVYRRDLYRYFYAGI